MADKMYQQKCVECQGLYSIHMDQSHPITHFSVIAPDLLFSCGFWLLLAYILQTVIDDW